MTNFIAGLSKQAREAPESGIVEVFNAGRDKENLIPLWAGEGDLPTPDFIMEAAKASLDRGETFYTHQRGIPRLRQALAEYHEAYFNRSFSSDRFFVTGSGMQAIQLAVQATAGPGDEVIVPGPDWPNITAAVGLRGANAVAVPMRFDGRDWALDLDDISASITPRTRAIFLNSPNNPTGWTADEALLRDLLKLAREKGLWIIADEIYALYFYGNERRAPSFYDIMDDSDRIVFVNTFSKNWAMTGWRIGWISAPPELGQTFENLIQYSTSGVPTFSQWAAVAALEDGAEFLESQVARARLGRDCVVRGLGSIDRIKVTAPAGAFYLFFSIDGVEDTRQFALDLVMETGVGLAPGTAFGDVGGSHLRLCYARDKDHLQQAVERIAAWLK